MNWGNQLFLNSILNSIFLWTVYEEKSWIKKSKLIGNFRDFFQAQIYDLRTLVYGAYTTTTCYYVLVIFGFIKPYYLCTYSSAVSFLTYLTHALVTCLWRTHLCYLSTQQLALCYPRLYSEVCKQNRMCVCKKRHLKKCIFKIFYMYI